MLVLTRTIDQGIRVGNLGRVVVVSVKGDKVRLGFERFDEIPIVRDELEDRPQIADCDIPIVPQS